MYANRNEYRKRKPLAIGVEDYKRIIDKSYYYMDKTLLIRELLDQGGTVSLFTRPRRFGKTLALSMVKTFFESELDEQGNPIDNSSYFDGMKIRYWRGSANYVLLQSDIPLGEKLLEHDILIRKCGNYRGLDDGYYRIAVKDRHSNEMLIEAMRKIL